MSRITSDRLVYDANGIVAQYKSPIPGVESFLVVPKRGGHIEILDLAAESSGTGIGRAAVTEFLSWAAANGFRQVRADSTRVAVGFWERQGFHDTGRKDGKLHIFSRHIAPTTDLDPSAPRRKPRP
ncbi:GNAT superfamily N-acetyltransferase [Roseateles asaccharophilus]|uniref:GNAT family N-acetyltransferase n=1 Tax=Roseateles asaccharophilus TaxID=582607 RepID=UPI0038396DAD